MVEEETGQFVTSQFIAIEGPGFKLRPFRADDRVSLARHANNRGVWRNLRDRFPHPYSIEDADRFIQRCTSEDPVLTLCVEVDEQCAGAIGIILRDDIYRRTAEIGYWLGESFWGRGIMTGAVKAMVSYAFRTFDLIRIDTGVLYWNPASMRVLEKAGFVREGIFRNGVFKDGQVVDEVRYAIFRPTASSPT